jgi:hypothetical protein
MSELGAKLALETAPRLFAKILGKALAEEAA